GMLYRVHLVLSLPLAPGAAHAWQLIVRFCMASAFSYGFARVLGLGRLPAVVAGLVFTFGSFTVGQLHHTNVGNSAIWLPAVLACLELALRRGGVGPAGRTGLRGLALGNALLGIHLQPVLMTLLALGLWAVFRATPPLVTPVLDARNGASPPVEHRWRQVRRAAGGALGVLVLPMAMLVV